MKIYSSLVICPQCGQAWLRRTATARHTAVCKRCRTVLWRGDDARLAHLLPMTLAALILYIIACFSPVISVNFHGFFRSASLWQITEFLSDADSFTLITIITALLLIAVPVMQLFLTALLLGFARFARPAPGFKWLMQLHQKLHPWNMAEIGLLGFLIAAIKLSSLLEVSTGPGGWAFAVATLLLVRINQYDLRPLWMLCPINQPRTLPETTCAPRVCDTCGLVSNVASSHPCPRCASISSATVARNIERSTALLCAAMLFYIPANLLPVMHTSLFGRGSESTIIDGIFEFWHSGSWGIALIIFFASMVIPCLKFLSLAVLLVTTRRKSGWCRRERTWLYRITEWIGYWSMLDVVVVAIISALVQFHGLSEAEPRIGIVFFALVVMLTMLAAQSFDSRQIWEEDE